MDLDSTVLQPALYLQAIDQAYRQALQTGAVVMPWSARSKMTYVDYRDVADAVAIAFTDSRLSGGTFEFAAGGMIDRIELAELMSRAAGRELVAADPPARPQRVADGLGAMFDHYSRYGFHGGNPDPHAARSAPIRHRSRPRTRSHRRPRPGTRQRSNRQHRHRHRGDSP